MSTNTSTSEIIIDPLNQIKYIIMKTFYIPSIIRTIFTLIYLLFNRNLRSSLHNHIQLIILIISIFDLLFNHSFTLNYLRTNQIIPSSNSLCLFWNLTNSIFTISIYHTMTWTSIERYLFIFHSKLFQTHRRRILFHYLPLISVSMIYPILISIIILIYPCQNQFNMNGLFCGYVCSLKIQSIALYTRIVDQFIPIFILTGMNLSILIRVFIQKQQIQQNQFNWRRYRLMIIQLLSLSSLFLLLTISATTVNIIQNCCLSSFASSIQFPYLNFLIRFVTIFMPFICLASLPEIWIKLFQRRIIQAELIRMSLIKYD